MNYKILCICLTLLVANCSMVLSQNSDYCNSKCGSTYLGTWGNPTGGGCDCFSYSSGSYKGSVS